MINSIGPSDTPYSNGYNLDTTALLDGPEPPAPPVLFAQGEPERGSPLEALDTWLKIVSPTYAIGKDFINALGKDPAGTLGLVWGGVVGGTHTVLDMAVGLYQLGETGLAGLLEIVNGLGVAVQMPFTDNPQLISGWAHEHSAATSEAVHKLFGYLLEHGSEIPGNVGGALQQEMRTIESLYNSGKTMEAGERFGHLMSSVFAGVEGGVSLAKSGVGLTKAFAQAMQSSVGATARMLRMIDTLRTLKPAQMPDALGFIDALTAEPGRYMQAPNALKSAIRQGLEPYAADVAVAQRLARLNELDGVATSARPAAALPAEGGTSGGMGGSSSTTAAADASVARAAEYERGIGNDLVRQGVTSRANALLRAGQTIDTPTLAAIEAEVQAQLAVNTRQAIAGQLFASPSLQAALRQRLADSAGTDPSKNAALANSPKAVQALAQDIVLDQLCDGLFQRSGVPLEARAAFRAKAQDWAQQALPQNPAAALEQLATTPAWQQALLRDVTVDQISGFSNAALNAMASSDPQAARALGEFRMRIAGALDRDYGSASDLKNLLATPGSHARTRLVREQVAACLGGDSPMAAALRNHAVNRGMGERQLIDLLSSPKAQVATLREALIQETYSSGSTKLSAAQRARLGAGIDARLKQLPDLAAQRQFLKDLSNSPGLLTQMCAEPAAAPLQARPGTPPAEPTPPSSDPTPPAAPAVPDAQIAGNVFMRGNQLVLRSADLEVVMPPGFQFRPLADIADLGGLGSGYTTISGHGSMMPNRIKAMGGSPLLTVPEGTRVVVVTPPGGLLGVNLGEHLDNREFTLKYGIDDPVTVPIRVPMRVLQAGETMPNLVAAPIRDLNVPDRPDIITVQHARLLSNILKPNMGTVVINICASAFETPPTRWSNLQFDGFSVINRGNMRVINYGLLLPADPPPDQ